MPTSGELITTVIEQHVNPGGGQIDDVTLRERCRIKAQQGVYKFCSFRPWSWMFGTGTVALTAGTGAGDLPSDFASMGSRLRVFISGDTTELSYKDPAWVFGAIDSGTNVTSSKPYVFTIARSEADGDFKIYTYPKNSTAITLLLENYKIKPPTLVDRPGPCTSAEGAAGNPNGTYHYKVTFVTAAGETEGGSASDAITVVSKRITVSEIPVSPVSTVTSRKLYRHANGSAQYKLVTTIADNVTTTYSDNLADGSLGANMPTAANAVSGLEQIPDHYHYGVLLDTIIALMMRGEGDGRSVTEMPPAIMNSFSQAWAEENVHHTRKRVPRFGRRLRIL